jgi:hypothetical protein
MMMMKMTISYRGIGTKPTQSKNSNAKPTTTTTVNDGRRRWYQQQQHQHHHDQHQEQEQWQHEEQREDKDTNKPSMIDDNDEDDSTKHLDGDLEEDDGDDDKFLCRSGNNNNNNNSTTNNTTKADDIKAWKQQMGNAWTTRPTIRQWRSTTTPRTTRGMTMMWMTAKLSATGTLDRKTSQASPTACLYKKQQTANTRRLTAADTLVGGNHRS